MHPIICKIGLFTVYSYGLTLVLAFLLCVQLATFQAKKQNIEPAIVSNFLFLVFVFGIIGARSFYVIENLSYYIRKPLEIILFSHGGLSWFGGLFLSIFAGTIYLRKKRESVYKIFDLIVPFIALGQAMGRIGCLLNGCCFGKPSKFGIYSPICESILIPTQIYSSLSLIFIFIILRFLQDKPYKKSEIFFAYLLLYSTKRFFIEFWRAEAEGIFLGLTLFQIISIVIFCFSLFKYIRLRAK